MPRCASASLKTFCDIYQIDYVGGTDYGFWGGSLWNRLKYKYTPYCLSKRILIDYGSKKFNEKFKFTSVRNPYSRALSIWRHDSFSKIHTFTEFCKCLNSQSFPSARAKWHASASAAHVFTEGELRVDYVLKVETLATDLSNCMHQFGISIDQISEFFDANPRIDNSIKLLSDEKYSMTLDSAYVSSFERDSVRKFYAKDFETFGYSEEVFW